PLSFEAAVEREAADRVVRAVGAVVAGDAIEAVLRARRRVGTAKRTVVAFDAAERRAGARASRPAADRASAGGRARRARRVLLERAARKHEHGARDAGREETLRAHAPMILAM